MPNVSNSKEIILTFTLNFSTHCQNISIQCRTHKISEQEDDISAILCLFEMQGMCTAVTY